MINKTLQYFDLITQNVFDIYSHLKFSQVFKGALIGRCNTVLLQYKANTGCMSPGFRFLLRTRPGIIYNITIDGLLHIGGPVEDNGAILFIESINPQYSIVPQEQSFKTGIPNRISLNFRAITNLTVIGILFVSDKISYCLEINELKVSKFSDALSEAGKGVDVGDGICQVTIPAKRPVCNIIDPPTVKQLIPPSKILCVDDFAASVVQEQGGWVRPEYRPAIPINPEKGLNLQRSRAISGFVKNSKKTKKPFKPMLDFDDDSNNNDNNNDNNNNNSNDNYNKNDNNNSKDNNNNQNDQNTNTPNRVNKWLDLNPLCDSHLIPSLEVPSVNYEIEQNQAQNQAQNHEPQDDFDYIGEVVQKITDKSGNSSSGQIVLEFDTGRLWIYNGNKFTPFESPKKICVFKNMNNGQIIEVEKSD